MVDVIKSLDFEYVAEPGLEFPRLHESLINYGGNKKPEFITCIHEESSVAMAHGYFKVAGKPMMCCATARSASSMRRWRSTTRAATACRSS